MRPRLVLVLERVEEHAEDAVDLGGIGDAGLFQAVGARLLQRVHLEAVCPRDGVLLAREAADQPAARVEDVERDVPVLVLEPVVDHRAGGWVLPHRMRFVGRELEAAAPVHAVRITRLEEMRRFPWDLPRQLA